MPRTAVLKDKLFEAGQPMSDLKPIGSDHLVMPVLPVAQTAVVHPRVTPPATVVSLSPAAVVLAHQAAGKTTDQIFAEQDRKKLVNLIRRILKDESEA